MRLHCIATKAGVRYQEVQSGKCSPERKSVGSNSGAGTKTTLSKVRNLVACGHGEVAGMKVYQQRASQALSGEQPCVLLCKPTEGIEASGRTQAGMLIVPSRHSRGNGNRAPAPATSSSDNGQELQAFCPTAGQCFFVWALLTPYSATACWPLAAVWARDPSRMPEVTARSKAAGPSSPQLPIHSTAGRVPGPARPPSSGAPPSSGRGGRRKKTRFFDFGVEPSCLQSGSDQHPQAVVALCAVATTRWNPGMVAVAVRHFVAHRARGVTWSRSRKRTIILQSGPAAWHVIQGQATAAHATRLSTGLLQQLEISRKASRLGPAAVKREAAASRPGLLLLHCSEGKPDLTESLVARTLEAYPAGAWMQAWRSPSPCNCCQGAKPSFCRPWLSAHSFQEIFHRRVQGSWQVTLQRTRNGAEAPGIWYFIFIYSISFGNRVII